MPLVPDHKPMEAVLAHMADTMHYTAYELSDEHIRGLFSARKPGLFQPLAEAHFDAWLAEHDRRMQESAWEHGRADMSGYLNGARMKVPYPTNPFKREESND